MKSRILFISGLALSALIAGVALAQTPPRIDPGVNPIPDLGAPPVWEFVQINGQAPASTLGNLAIRPTDGSLFVWSMHQELRPIVKTPATPLGELPRRGEPGDPLNPGEGGPGGPGIPREMMTVSTLYQFTGGVWVPALVASDQTAGSVYIGPLGDIFANTNLPDGTFRVYHRYTAGWKVEPTPAGVIGPAGAFAGDGEVLMRTGNAILRHTGHSWSTVINCAEFVTGDGLLTLDQDHIFAPCDGHEHVFNGTIWFTNEEVLPTHVHSIWAGRDINGDLHMFAGGSDPAGLEARIFQFVELQQGSLMGRFQMSLDEPAVGTMPGYINTVWGSDVHDVYATGLDRGFGQLYRFNGNGWVNAAPQSNLPETKGIVGDEASGLWVSLADGRLLHRPAAVSIIPPAEESTGPAPPPFVPASGVMARTELAVVGAPASQATLRFALPEARDVSLRFFDVNGRLVDAMSAGRLAAGVHQLTWNANRFPSGLYFCRLEAGALQATSKVLVRK